VLQIFLIIVLLRFAIAANAYVLAPPKGNPTCDHVPIEAMAITFKLEAIVQAP
jgi:hypothetical protein